MSVKITGIQKDSPISKYDVTSGDILISINGNEIDDVLDYMFYAAEAVIDLEILRDKTSNKFTVIKSEYDDLGLEFETFLMDEKQKCQNNCVFCFIDQMPPNMRETLYFKDDDARLSFIHGNYVTLTNLKQHDIDRIIKMHLNINISVHTTNPELRCKMMNNRFAGEKLNYLFQLGNSGIMMNCQIVLCPGLNDGVELERTLNDLHSLMPSIQSIAIVPVGLSKFREGLFELNAVTKQTAIDTISIVNRYQEKFLKEFGNRLVFVSDEFYLIAEKDIPTAEYYEDYPQYENGVGMIRSLEDEFENAFEDANYNNSIRKLSIATGKLAGPLLEKIAKKINDKWNNLTCEIYSINNYFFGENITVAGLITGQDLISQLKDKNLGEVLLIPSAMIKKDSDLFLDDITISQAEQELSTKIKIVENDGYMLLDNILGIEN